MDSIGCQEFHAGDQLLLEDQAFDVQPECFSSTVGLRPTHENHVLKPLLHNQIFFDKMSNVFLLCKLRFFRKFVKKFLITQSKYI